jgi:hypothetical protein
VSVTLDLGTLPPTSWITYEAIEITISAHMSGTAVNGLHEVIIGGS